MRRLVILAAVLLLLPSAVRAQDASTSLRRALHHALDGWPAITVGAPDAATIEGRLKDDRETLRKLTQRHAQLEKQIVSLDGRIKVLKKRITQDSGSMATPRNQMVLVALQDQRETVRHFRDALAQSMAALTDAVAREEVQLLAVQGGRDALEKRLAQISP